MAMLNETVNENGNGSTPEIDQDNVNRLLANMNVDSAKMGVSTNLPVDLYATLSKAAKAQNVSPGAYVRAMIASEFGYELPATAERASKYSDPAAKAKADAERKAAHKELVKRALQAALAEND